MKQPNKTLFIKTLFTDIEIYYRDKVNFGINNSNLNCVILKILYYFIA